MFLIFIHILYVHMSAFTLSTCPLFISCFPNHLSHMVGSSLALAKWKQNTFSQTTCWKITSSGNTGKPTMHQRKHQPYNIIQTFLPPPANWNPPIPNNTELNLPYANRTFPFGKKSILWIVFLWFFLSSKRCLLGHFHPIKSIKIAAEILLFPRWWWPLVHRSSKSLPAIYLLLLAQLLQSKSIPINCICWRVLPSHPQSLQTNRSCSLLSLQGPHISCQYHLYFSPYSNSNKHNFSICTLRLSRKGAT